MHANRRNARMPVHSALHMRSLRFFRLGFADSSGTALTLSELSVTMGTSRSARPCLRSRGAQVTRALKIAQTGIIYGTY